MSPVVHIVAIISLFSAELEEPRIGISGKELTPCLKTDAKQEQLNCQQYPIDKFAKAQFRNIIMKHEVRFTAKVLGENTGIVAIGKKYCY